MFISVFVNCLENSAQCSPSEAEKLGVSLQTTNILTILTVVVIDTPILLVAAFCIVIIVKLGQFPKYGKECALLYVIIIGMAVA